MRLLLILLLLCIALEDTLARNLVKRSCCDNNYNDCSSSRSTPCSRRTICNQSPCNRERNCRSCNHEDEEPEEIAPVLIPFPPITPSPQPSGSTTNNTNVNNNTFDITITNSIDNVNNISVPISLNSTNQNTVVIHFEKLPSIAVENRTVVQPSSECCYVTTYEGCDANERNCEVKRRYECSDVCKGLPREEIREVPAQLTAPTPPVQVNQTQVLVQQPQAPYQVVYQPIVRPVVQPVLQSQIWRQVPVRTIQQPVYVQQRIQRPVYYTLPRPTVMSRTVYVQQPVQQPVSQMIQVPYPVQTSYPVQQTSYPVQSSYSVQAYPIQAPYPVQQQPCPYAKPSNPSPCGSSGVLY